MKEIKTPARLSEEPLPPLLLRGLRVMPPLVLAPMAGLTHTAFRQIVVGFGGCGLFLSEMLSCRAVVHEDPEQSFFLKRRASEEPFFYQLVGNEPEDFARAVRHLENRSESGGRPCDGFDINMGCGAPRLRNRGLGSGLLRDPDRARRVLAACRKATERPLTAKIRLCWTEAGEETIRFARRLQEEGVDGVTLHPRLPKEKFRRSARWRVVGQLKRELEVPVIGNGDIRAPQDVGRRMTETGCDGVMIGRLAVARPWIFRVVSDPGYRAPVDRNDLFERFTELLEENFPPERRAGRLKMFMPYFSEGFTFGHRLRTAVQNAPSYGEAVQETRRFLKRHGAECRVDPVTGRPVDARRESVVAPRP